MSAVTSISSPTNLRILTDRDTLVRCQISVPDLDQPLEAIYLEDRYYGLMKSFTDQRKLMEVLGRLGRKQEDVILAPLQSNRTAVWIWEPNATRLQSEQRYQEDSGTNAPLLTTRRQYRTCRIQLPDGDRCPAVVYQNSYYSFFRTLSDQLKTTALVQKLEQQRNRCLVTQTFKGYGIWVLEADAIELR